MSQSSCVIEKKIFFVSYIVRITRRMKREKKLASRDVSRLTIGILTYGYSNQQTGSSVA